MSDVARSYRDAPCITPACAVNKGASELEKFVRVSFLRAYNYDWWHGGSANNNQDRGVEYIQ